MGLIFPSGPFVLVSKRRLKDNLFGVPPTALTKATALWRLRRRTRRFCLAGQEGLGFENGFQVDEALGGFVGQSVKQPGISLTQYAGP